MVIVNTRYMWTRKLSSNMAGINEDDFVQAFIRALSNDAVIGKLQNAVCGQLQKEVGVLRDLVKSKDDQIKKLDDRIRALEMKQDDTEQYSRRNSLRISGIKEATSEDIGETVLDLFNNSLDITPQITLNQIDRVHRVGPRKENSPRAVLVKFATYRTRDAVFRQRTKLKKKSSRDNQNQVSDVDEDKRNDAPIFINEDLTRNRSHLLYLARQAKIKKKIIDCWSWDGTILIKDKMSRIIPIRSESDLLDAC